MTLCLRALRQLHGERVELLGAPAFRYGRLDGGGPQPQPYEKVQANTR